MVVANVSAIVPCFGCSRGADWDWLICLSGSKDHCRVSAGSASCERQTVLTNVITGRPARGIVTRLVRELGPMSDEAPEFHMAALPLAPLRSKEELAGSGDSSPLWADQAARLGREMSAGQLTKQLAAEAKSASKHSELNVSLRVLNAIYASRLLVQKLGYRICSASVVAVLVPTTVVYDQQLRRQCANSMAGPGVTAWSSLPTITRTLALIAAAAFSSESP